MDKCRNLDKIARSYSEDHGFESVLMKYKIIAISEFIKGKTMLDIGCGVGTLTKALAHNFETVIGIDGSDLKIKKAKQNNKAGNIKYVFSLFEDYEWNTQFDFIVCTNILEHVDDSLSFLTQIKKLLSRDGVVVITVPNALGLHKRIGKAMGLINDFYELTPADLAKGHRRVYDMLALKEEFLSVGYKILHLGGILLKPLSHKQMETWDLKVVDALYEVGKQLTEYCSSLLIVALH